MKKWSSTFFVQKQPSVWSKNVEHHVYRAVLSRLLITKKMNKSQQRKPRRKRTCFAWKSLEQTRSNAKFDYIIRSNREIFQCLKGVSASTLSLLTILWTLHTLKTGLIKWPLTTYQRHKSPIFSPNMYVVHVSTLFEIYFCFLHFRCKTRTYYLRNHVKIILYSKLRKIFAMLNQNIYAYFSLRRRCVKYATTL